MATASGVNALLVPTAASAAMTQVHALSPDGRCKAFGAEADGYGRGEGYAAIVLEPARATSTAALALYAGTAVNQDGRSSGLTAPHGPSQQALVVAAMREAGAAVLEYVAAHGTGALSCPFSCCCCCRRGPRWQRLSRTTVPACPDLHQPRSHPLLPNLPCRHAAGRPN